MTAASAPHTGSRDVRGMGWWLGFNMVGENSPAFQGWVGRRGNKKSRQGRKKTSAVPDGTGEVGTP